MEKGQGLVVSMVRRHRVRISSYNRLTIDLSVLLEHVFYYLLCFFHTWGGRMPAYEPRATHHRAARVSFASTSHDRWRRGRGVFVLVSRALRLICDVDRCTRETGARGWTIDRSIDRLKSRALDARSSSRARWRRSAVARWRRSQSAREWTDGHASAIGDGRRRGRVWGSTRVSIAVSIDGDARDGGDGWTIRKRRRSRATTTRERRRARARDEGG